MQRRTPIAATLFLLLVATACGRTPAATDQARGVLEGTNTVLMLSIIIVALCVGLIVVAVGVDNALRARRALADAPDDAEEDLDADEQMAGIGVGRAPVPRWLYGFYVLIPLFAMLYVVNNTAFVSEADGPAPTEAPVGPVTEVTVVAETIAFDLDELVFPTATDVTITFDNRDSAIPHNLTIWQDEASATANDQAAVFAATSTFDGVDEETITYTTGDTGTFFFNCTIHPAMKGDVQVVDASAEPAPDTGDHGDEHA